MDTSEGTETVEQQESLDLIGNFFLYLLYFQYIARNCSLE